MTNYRIGPYLTMCENERS